MVRDHLLMRGFMDGYRWEGDEDDYEFVHGISTRNKEGGEHHVEDPGHDQDVEDPEHDQDVEDPGHDHNVGDPGPDDEEDQDGGHHDDHEDEDDGPSSMDWVQDPYLQELLLKQTSNARAAAREKAKMDQLEVDAVTPLYEGCRPEDTRLKVTLMALEMKVKHKMTDTSFNDNMSFWHERLPKGNDINLYMGLLKEELATLWDTPANTWDAAAEEYFPMRAALLTTVHDFLDYGYVAGQVVHGFNACVRCMDDTTYRQLDRDPGSSKTVFMGHRRWLREDDPWRKRKDLFDGQDEPRRRPRTRSGEQIDELLKNWKECPPPGKKRKAPEPLLKNVCESLLGTLLNMPEKTKDGPKARYDLQSIGIREELHAGRPNDDDDDDDDDDDEAEDTQSRRKGKKAKKIEYYCPRVLHSKQLRRLRKDRGDLVRACDVLPRPHSSTLWCICWYISWRISSKLGPTFLHNMMPFERMNGVIKGAEHNLMTFQAYDINGYTFYTEEKDMKSDYQNSGVTMGVLHRCSSGCNLVGTLHRLGAGPAQASSSSSRSVIVFFPVPDLLNCYCCWCSNMADNDEAGGSGSKPFWMLTNEMEVMESQPRRDDGEDDGTDPEYRADDAAEDDTTDGAGEDDTTDGAGEDDTTDGAGEDDTGKPKKLRRERRLNVLSTVKQAFTEVNASGHPTAPPELVKGYSAQLGCILRSTVSINTENLRHPDRANLRTLLFTKLHERYEFPVDCSEKRLGRNKVHNAALTKMSIALASWRNRVKKMIKKGESYEKIKESNPSITEQDYADFKIKCESESTSDSSQWGKDMRKLNLGTHKLGPGGFRAAQPKWDAQDKERVKNGLQPLFSQYKNKQTRQFLLARYRVDPTTKELTTNPEVKEFEALLAKEEAANKEGETSSGAGSTSSSQCAPWDNPLNRALNAHKKRDPLSKPTSAGRVVGEGCSMKWSDYYKSGKKEKKATIDEKEVAHLKAQVAQIPTLVEEQGRCVISPNTLKKACEEENAVPVNTKPKGRKRKKKDDKSASQPAPIRAQDGPPVPKNIESRVHVSGERMLIKRLYDVAPGPMRSLVDGIQFMEERRIREKDHGYPVYVAKVPSGHGFVDSGFAEKIFLRYDDIFAMLNSYPLHYTFIRLYSLSKAMRIIRNNIPDIAIADPFYMRAVHLATAGDRAVASGYLKDFFLANQKKCNLLLPVFPEDKTCTLISITPKHSVATYLDADGKSTTDYTNVKAVLDDALNGYVKAKGHMQRPNVRYGKHVFKHQTKFPCVKKPPSSNKDAYYALYHMNKFIRDQQQLTLPEHLRDWANKLSRVPDDGIKQDFFRIQVEFCEIIHQDVVTSAGEFYAGYQPSNSDIDTMLQMQGDDYRSWMCLKKGGGFIHAPRKS
ncbi:hypothetical protein QYE76_046286 [Lolium multiflorum]|uniref:Uncharacterized protein n=1 Tax=Lolium multiflorum TaxID=4521 RepID=A0AAD8TP88_LOLMU|nr:hypothetical protein QYE76_046286 [Lolium multiflorum]